MALVAWMDATRQVAGLKLPRPCLQCPSMSLRVCPMHTSVTINEYAELIGTSAKTVRRWISEGLTLPPPAIRLWGGGGVHHRVVIDHLCLIHRPNKEN